MGELFAPFRYALFDERVRVDVEADQRGDAVLEEDALVLRVGGPRVGLDDSEASSS